MSSHQATEQMLGYLYQIRYALILLLDSEDDELQISIEKFDDVAFSKANVPTQLIQLKHHIKNTGNLTDASTDLWRTLKVWLDIINIDPSLLNTTKFLIITTATAPDDSAASFLRTTNRNSDTAYDKLNSICTTSQNAANQNYYTTFLNTKESFRKSLLKNTFVLDKASNINNSEKILKQKIKYSCLPKYQNQICERLEGWWYRQAIEALSSDTPVFINQQQIRSFIVSISQEYSDDNLPIDILGFSEDLQEQPISSDDTIFYEQLKLICLGSTSVKLALKDYYRAFHQRAKWVRNNLLYIDELEKYETRLIDEWQHYFAQMEDELLYEDDEPSEKIKAKLGRSLFSKISEKEIRIRPKCNEPFIMRGSYHILANQLKVGWHIDFYLRLKDLLS